MSFPYLKVLLSAALSIASLVNVRLEITLHVLSSLQDC